MKDKINDLATNSKNKNIRYLYRGINGLKQGDAFSLLLFNVNLEHTISNVKENQVGLKVNGTHQLLVYADYVNLLGDNTETLTDARKEVSLE
jgi:hypothetical protein